MTLEALQVSLATLPECLDARISSGSQVLFRCLSSRSKGSQRSNQMNTSAFAITVSIRETADLLTISKIAVYPIGAEGVMSEHVLSADV